MTTQGRAPDWQGDLSQKRSQTPSETAGTAPEPDLETPPRLTPPMRSTRAHWRIRDLVDLALEFRCPICRARVGRYCNGPDFGEPRRRIGRELLHVVRIDLAAVRDEERHAERIDAVRWILGGSAVHRAEALRDPRAPEEIEEELKSWLSD